MANAREIKSRINSVQDTMKITNAMYMISSSKMKKAKKILSDTEPYFYNMQSAIARILRHIPDTQHPFFSVRHLIPTEERKIATIVVTGDKGMAGAYNHNITKMTEEFMQKREELVGIVMLIDIRHEPGANDKVMYDWLKHYGYKIVIAATKLDKIKRSQIQKQVSLIRKSLGLGTDDIVIQFSGVEKKGKEELWKVIDEELLKVEE